MCVLLTMVMITAQEGARARAEQDAAVARARDEATAQVQPLGACNCVVIFPNKK